MSKVRRVAEVLVLALIVYSILAQFAELEFTDTEHSVGFFLWSERVVAALFTVEYIARWAGSRSLFYPFRPLAIVDLVAILPFYIGFLVDLRALRLVRALRVLRLFKLYRYTGALRNLVNAFNRIRYEFAVIGFAVLTLAWMSTVAIYELEKPAQPEAFAKLSDAAWYTVVTLTTVGYGDKVPVTTAGRIVASMTMLAGLGLFGTFISLIGGAFLEELRNAARPAGPEKTVSPAFDPQHVLNAIEQGSRPSHDEAVQLLVCACRRLVQEGAVKVKRD